MALPLTRPSDRSILHHHTGHYWRKKLHVRELILDNAKQMVIYYHIEYTYMAEQDA